MSIMEKFKLNGKIALVTGCSKGIGFGIAKGLAEAGADIIGVSSTLDKGSDIEKYVESIGKKFHCFRCDFSKRQNTHNFLRELGENNLEPNILVSNAGSLIRTELSEHIDEHWDRILEINLSSQFVLARELSSKMIERGWGKIIFTASILSHQGGLFVPSYTASKGIQSGLIKYAPLPNQEIRTTRYTHQPNPVWREAGRSNSNQFPNAYERHLRTSGS